MLAKDSAVVKLLLAAGADVTKTTSTSNTPLHVAAAHDYPASVICLLIKAGAKISAVNGERRTAVQVAQFKGYTRIAALLARAAQA
jgi:ankyrin repeat protein